MLARAETKRGNRFEFVRNEEKVRPRHFFKPQSRVNPLLECETPAMSPKRAGTGPQSPGLTAAPNLISSLH